jgi:hypothetical protein
MKAYFALLIAISLATGLMSGPLYAKDTKKTTTTCPGGMAACIKGCIAAGGQGRFCPNYCQKQKGC